MSIFLLGAVFVLSSLVPGYAVSLMFPWVRGAAVRLGVALVSGVSVGVAIATLIAYAGFSLVPWFLAVLTMFTLVVGWVARRRIGVIYREWCGVARREAWFIAAAFLLSLAAAVLVFTPHRGYPWPIHADEWWGVGTVQNLLEGKGLNSHPYLFTEFTNDKPGYTSYVAALVGSVGIDPIVAWRVFPAANMFLVSFVGALALFGASGNPFLAAMLPVFLAALRSNAYTLGWWFMVPSMFGLFFLLPLLLSFSEHIRGALAWGWRALVFAALALVYPPLAVVVALVMAFMAVADAKRRWLVGAVLGLLLVLGAVLGSSVSPYRVYWDFPGVPAVSGFLSDLVRAFFVPVEGTIHFGAYRDLLMVVGIPTLLLALLGLWWVRRARWAWPLGVGALLMAANFALIWGADVSFALFHQRALYVLGVMVALLAPLGAWELVRTLGRYAEGETGGKWMWTVPLGLGLLAVMFFNYFDMRDGTKLYYVAARGDIAAMEWLKVQDDFKGMTVVADPFPGTIIPAFTRLASKVSFLTDQSAARFTASGATLALSVGDCAAKREFLVRMDADLVYTAFRQSCPFLTEVYNAPRVFMYLTEKGAAKRQNADVDN